MCRSLHDGFPRVLLMDFDPVTVIEVASGLLAAGGGLTGLHIRLKRKRIKQAMSVQTIADPAAVTRTSIAEVILEQATDENANPVRFGEDQRYAACCQKWMRAYGKEPGESIKAEIRKALRME